MLRPLRKVSLCVCLSANISYRAIYYCWVSLIFRWRRMILRYDVHRRWSFPGSLFYKLVVMLKFCEKTRLLIDRKVIVVVLRLFYKSRCFSNSSKEIFYPQHYFEREYIVIKIIMFSFLFEKTTSLRYYWRKGFYVSK